MMREMDATSLWLLLGFSIVCLLWWFVGMIV